MMFLERPFDPPAHTKSLPVPGPDESVIKVGDEVKLYLKGDPDQKPIWLRVTSIDQHGEMTGTVSRGNAFGAQGDERLLRGKPIEFHERHVIQFSKAIYSKA